MNNKTQDKQRISSAKHSKSLKRNRRKGGVPFSTTIKFITNLVCNIFILDKKSIAKVFKILLKIKKDNGLLYMYKYMKQARLHVTRYIAGKPLKHNDVLVSVTNGWPTKFLFLKPLLFEDNKGLRSLLTLMNFSKAIVPGKKDKLIVSYKSITDEYSGNKNKYYIPRFFIDVMKRKYQIHGELEENNSWTFFMNMKSCPTGTSSILAAPGESALFHGDLLESLTILLGERGMRYFYEARDFVMKNPLYLPNIIALMVLFGQKVDDLLLQSVPLGRLGTVNDSEGKVRIVAMLDYWSQWALKPMHDDLLRILRRIPMDRTFTQDPHHGWEDNDEHFWSLDLTAATDRFPIWIQEKVIKAFYGFEKGEAWSNLLIGRDYATPSGDHLRYEVGQPMGAYSSWATFAVTHHFVVQWAALLCGYNNFDQYILLGDDIVIKNDKVALKYIALMKRWGVEISVSKTHKSRNSYEFAKRWIHFNQEISPLPVKGIAAHIGELKTVLHLVSTWHLKTHYLLGSGSSAYEVVKESYKGLQIKGQWLTTELLSKNLYDYFIGLSYIQMNILPSELRGWFIHKGWDESYLPTNEEIVDFSLRLIDLSVGNVIQSINYSVFTLAEELFSKLHPDIKDRSEISWHPLIHSVRNTPYNLKLKLESYESINNGLKELLEFLAIPGVNDIVHLKRIARKEVTGIDRLWKPIEVTIVLRIRSPYDVPEEISLLDFPWWER
jgi:hypothetical protein